MDAEESLVTSPGVQQWVCIKCQDLEEAPPGTVSHNHRACAKGGRCSLVEYGTERVTPVF